MLFRVQNSPSRHLSQAAISVYAARQMGGYGTSDIIDNRMLNHAIIDLCGPVWTSTSAISHHARSYLRSNPTAPYVPTTMRLHLCSIDHAFDTLKSVPVIRI